MTENTGIGSITTVSGGTVIGILQGTLIVEGGQTLPPLEVLRRHVSNAPAAERAQFEELERELTKSKPEKPKVDGILASLGNVLGGAGACAAAIAKISEVVAGV